MSININTLAANFDAGVSNYALHELKELSTGLKPLQSAKLPQLFQPEPEVNVRLDYLSRKLHVLNGGRPSKILVDYVHRNLSSDKALSQKKKKRQYPNNKNATKLFNRYRQIAEDDARKLGLEGEDFNNFVVAGACAKSGDTVARLFNRNYRNTYESLKIQTEQFVANRRSLFLMNAGLLSGAELRLFISLVIKASDMVEIIIQIMDRLDDNTRFIFLQETIRQKPIHLIPFLKIAEDAIKGEYLDQLFGIMAGLSDEDLSRFLSTITKTPDSKVILRTIHFIESLSETEKAQFLFLAQIPEKSDFYLLFNAFETITQTNIRSRALDTACNLPEKDVLNYLKALAHSEKMRDMIMTGFDRMKKTDDISNFLFLAAWHPQHIEKVIQYERVITNKNIRASFLNVAVNADNLLNEFLQLYSEFKHDQRHAFLEAAEKHINMLYEFFTQVEEKKGYDRLRFISAEKGAAS
jgi:cell fate (sporulation/competence/biofilm development) regulator YlbF (YheA/YmcA/DUF963 family)